MSVTNHTITVYVGALDKTTSVKKDSLFIRMQLNNTSSIAELKFKNYVPDERSEVKIYINGTLVFGGYVIEREANILGAKNQTSVEWSVTCKDYSDILEQVTVNEEYSIVSDSYIIADLFSTYLSSSGFDTSTSVHSLDNDLDITFTDVTLRDALNQLAEQVGANWYIKPNKEIYWFSPINPDTASFNISSSPNQSTTFGFLQNSLKYKTDASTIINQVKVVAGTKAASTKITDTFTGDGSKKTFTLSQTPDSILYINYTTNVGNYTSYGSFIGYAPGDSLTSEGGTYKVVVDPNNKTIRCEGSSNEAPSNGGNVEVVYYYKEGVEVTVSDTYSQSLFGTFPTTISNKTFTSDAQAEQLAQQILDANAYGKKTIQFDTTKYGLLPGQLITVDISELGIGTSTQDNLMLLESFDYVLLESGDKFLLEGGIEAYQFLIQEINLTPVITQNNQFMIVCQVIAGQYIPTLIDSLGKLSELRSTPGKAKTLEPVTARLSDISSNMGEVVLGRAVFTDGGTARFSWSDPGGATGAVIGLEDSSNLYGAVYIYNAGTVKAKLGRLNDVPAIGTIQPSGWGLYTDNGFFKGTVASSYLFGGTVEGNYINGGTVTGALVSGNTVSGGTINGAIVIGGTIASGTPPINSSNTGVYLDSTGLYGYGSAGLTFRLSSDPAIKPWFSSGTILNTVYEINTAAVLRTGTTNPRIQIDNSGIFAYDSAGTLRFTVDVATGRLTASQGTFSGTVSASALNSSTLTSGTVTGSLVTAGTVSGNLVSGGTVSGSYITGGTITGGLINGQNITGGTISGGLISGQNISGGTVSGALISGNTISGGTVTGSYITGGTLSNVSGSVTIGTAGVLIEAPTSYAFSSPNSVKWQYSGTVVAELSTTHDTTAPVTDQVRLVAGKFGTGNRSYLGLIQNGNVGNASQITLTNGTININADANLLVYSNLIPNDTANNLQLGDSSHAFRYLYLKDDSGVTRRVSINSSGVLTVT